MEKTDRTDKTVHFFSLIRNLFFAETLNITEVRNLFAYFEILPNLVIPLYVFNIEISLFKSFDWNITGKFYRIAVFLSNVVKIWLFIYLF